MELINISAKGRHYQTTDKSEAEAFEKKFNGRMSSEYIHAVCGYWIVTICEP